MFAIAVGIPGISQGSVSVSPIDQPQPDQHVVIDRGGGGGGNGASTDGDNGNRCCRTCR
ncbi:MAG: hypothetical protein GFH27_549291n284 [Chloroflexi bacterium AL-W]|nr:hypothetical protein [Chloroflexi bacterium AL-N1]NOK67248.1 hypothetical protein [Chloroflexi bacterium AL-N10]NOK75258.1 hypothetical protein [Chloroflexi bacterium AL-N5]NOK82046.1 hypothetical protein [Chloroflexi bacterium AL-W]NOK89891.1 hypothetical protein [Chloroflexi bacterium AL-N15]